MENKFLGSTGLAKMLERIYDTFSKVGHTHDKSQITDFPTIPTNTSQLTNDSGFVTADEIDLTTTVDSELSESSENPVQNKVIKTEFDLVHDLIEEAGAVDIDLNGENIGSSASLDADTLGGYSANDYIRKDEIIDADLMNGKAESELSVSDAATLGGKTEGELSVANSDALGNQLPEYYAAAEQLLEAKTEVKNYADIKSSPYNLLDNSDFTNPVNQRGESSYTGSVYGIDRWICTGASSVLEVGDGFVKFTNTNTSNMFRQDIDNVSRIAGKKVTFAMMVESVDNSTPFSYIRADRASGDNANARGEVISNNGISICVLDIPSDVTSVYCGICVNNASGASCKCYWAALYEGEYTSDNLPAYHQKGYSAELGECIRYFRRIDYGAVNSYSGHITGTTRVSVAFGYCPFRVIPTAKMSSDFALTLRLGSGGYSSIAGIDGAKPSDIVGVYMHGYMVSVYFEMGESPGTNNMPITAVIANGYIDLSADL